MQYSSDTYLTHLVNLVNGFALADERSTWDECCEEAQIFLLMVWCVNGAQGSREHKAMVMAFLNSDAASEVGCELCFLRSF